MKRLRRIFALIIALLIACSCLSACGSDGVAKDAAVKDAAEPAPEEEETAAPEPLARPDEAPLESGECGNSGDNLKWDIYDDGRLLFISGNGKMVDSIGGAYVPWRSYSDVIEHAVIEPGATSVGKLAFDSCKNLTDIVIPEGVTEIGVYAFYDCESLREVVIPETVTVIESSSFCNCRSLTELYLPDSVKEIGTGAFQGCSGLKSVRLPEGIEEIVFSMFRGCSSLSSFIIPDTVVKIGKDAFGYCSSLKEVFIPAGVTEIGEGAFQSCVSLLEVDIAPENPVFVSVDGVMYDKDMTTMLFFPVGRERGCDIPESVTTIQEGVFTKISPFFHGGGPIIQGGDSLIPEVIREADQHGAALEDGTLDPEEALHRDGIRIIPLTYDGGSGAWGLETELLLKLPSKIRTLSWREADYAIVMSWRYSERSDYVYSGTNQKATTIDKARFMTITHTNPDRFVSCSLGRKNTISIAAMVVSRAPVTAAITRRLW